MEPLRKVLVQLKLYYIIYNYIYYDIYQKLKSSSYYYKL